MRREGRKAQGVGRRAQKDLRQAGSDLYDFALGFMSKNTNSKHQITNKSQVPIFNDQDLQGHCLDFRILAIEICLVFGV